MRSTSYYRHRQRSNNFVALLLFQLVLVVLQLWLFLSALDGLLAGNPGMALPGAVVSAACLAVNTWMLLGVERTDREG